MFLVSLGVFVCFSNLGNWINSVLFNNNNNYNNTEEEIDFEKMMMRSVLVM